MLKKLHYRIHCTAFACFPNFLNVVAEIRLALTRVSHQLRKKEDNPFEYRVTPFSRQILFAFVQNHRTTPRSQLRQHQGIF
jgi:hypothetical protein